MTLNPTWGVSDDLNHGGRVHLVFSLENKHVDVGVSLVLRLLKTERLTFLFPRLTGSPSATHYLQKFVFMHNKDHFTSRFAQFRDFKASFESENKMTQPFVVWCRCVAPRVVFITSRVEKPVERRFRKEHEQKSFYRFFISIYLYVFLGVSISFYFYFSSNLFPTFFQIFFILLLIFLIYIDFLDVMKILKFSHMRSWNQMLAKCLINDLITS